MAGGLKWEVESVYFQILHPSKKLNHELSHQNNPMWFMQISFELFLDAIGYKILVDKFIAKCLWSYFWKYVYICNCNVVILELVAPRLLNLWKDHCILNNKMNGS